MWITSLIIVSKITFDSCTYVASTVNTFAYFPAFEMLNPLKIYHLLVNFFISQHTISSCENDSLLIFLLRNCGLMLKPKPIEGPLWDLTNFTLVRCWIRTNIKWNHLTNLLFVEIEPITIAGTIDVRSGVNFIYNLQAAFMRANPKSAKKTVKL